MRSRPGKTTARPDFREMIAMARRRSKPFDAILIWKFARFARNREDSIVYKTLLRKIGIKVISINEPIEDTATGKLMEAIIESMDEFYSANLGEEVTRGMRESASRGFYIASYAPYGYRRIKVKDGAKERPKLEPDPHEAQVITRIFKGVLEGKGLKEILKGLNKEGVAGPRGRGWIKTTLHKIICNEAYTGTLVWGRNSVRQLAQIRVENAWPAIIDNETFAQAQNILKGRAPAYLHPKRTASNFLLSGIAECGYCGKALVGHEAKSGQFSYYVCGTLLKKGSGACEAKYISSKMFEGLVIDKIKEHILTEENLRELVRLVNEELDAASAECQAQLNTVKEEVADVDRRLDRLYDAVETGKLDNADLAPRIKQLRERKDNLQARKWELEWQLKEQRVELADIGAVTRYVEDLRNILSEGSIVERKSFIKSFVKKVEVTGSEVCLTYTIPLSKGGLTREQIPVLSTVHYGGQYWI